LIRLSCISSSEIVSSQVVQQEVLGMKNGLVNLTYEVELEPGEKLTLPESLIAHDECFLKNGG